MSCWRRSLRCDVFTVWRLKLCYFGQPLLKSRQGNNMTYLSTKFRKMSWWSHSLWMCHACLVESNSWGPVRPISASSMYFIHSFCTRGINMLIIITFSRCSLRCNYPSWKGWLSKLNTPYYLASFVSEMTLIPNLDLMMVAKESILKTQLT